MRSIKIVYQSVVTTSGSNCALGAEKAGNKFKGSAGVIVEPPDHARIDTVSGADRLKMLPGSGKMIVAAGAKVVQYRWRSNSGLLATDRFTVKRPERIGFEPSFTVVAELIEPGTRSPDSMFHQAQQENKLIAWILRLAGAVVGDRAAAEEVVQDTWMAILEGLPRFECRCSLRGWMYRILVNRSRTRRAREGRSVAFSRLRPVEGEAEADPLDGGDRGAGRWEERSPEALLAGAETRRAVESAISRLPPSQRAVLTLRDVEGLETEEICRALGITPANQRVLLHRARTRVRAALEAA